RQFQSWLKTAFLTQSGFSFDAASQVEKRLTCLAGAGTFQLFSHDLSLRQTGSLGFFFQPVSQLIGQTNRNSVTHGWKRKTILEIRKTERRVGLNWRLPLSHDNGYNVPNCELAGAL